MVVMVGQTDMRVMERESASWQSRIYKIAKVEAHSRFEWESVNNDIALIKLDKPVSQSATTGYSCVPGSDLDAPPGTVCTVVGWGKNRKYSNRRSSKRLRQAKVPLVSRKTCKNSFNFTITKNQMCAGYDDGRSDSCDGDSGGPLMCLAQTQAGARWVIYGITSFGPNDGCGIAGKYGVYTKVNNYSTWISDILNTSRQDTPSSDDPQTERRRRRHRKRRRKKKNKSRQRAPPIQSSIVETGQMMLNLYRSLAVTNAPSLLQTWGSTPALPQDIRTIS